MRPRNAAPAAATRVLVAGWFSIERGGTAGDVLAAEVVSGWLAEAGCPHDVALSGTGADGVDWQAVDPADYSHLVVVCGPAGRGLRIAKLIRRFRGRPVVGVNLSMLQSLEEWNPFSALIERDSARATRPDLVFLAPPRRVPVVGRVLAHTQREYDRPLHDVAHEALDRLLAGRALATVAIDTRLPPKNKTGLRTAGEVESLLARMDAVVTTRLHGLVLALKNGVPALAIDAIGGGAKVRAQAGAVGWPAVFSADSLDDAALGEALDWCLSPEARERAARCAAAAIETLAPLPAQVLGALGHPTPAP